MSKTIYSDAGPTPVSGTPLTLDPETAVKVLWEELEAQGVEVGQLVFFVQGKEPGGIVMGHGFMGNPRLIADRLEELAKIVREYEPEIPDRPGVKIEDEFFELGSPEWKEREKDTKP